MLARVTDIDLFRVWRDEDGLDLEWLLSRYRGEGKTERMMAGTAFHKALEEAGEGEVDSLFYDKYRFDFNCDCKVVLPKIREVAVSKQYGPLTVVGHTDAIVGKEVQDYKTTETFDPDKYFEGFQWRFYLDLTECDSFLWKVFVIKEFGKPDDDLKSYEVRDTHELRQSRYPDLHADCAQLASEYYQFAAQYLVPQEIGA